MHKAGMRFWGVVSAVYGKGRGRHRRQQGQRGIPQEIRGEIRPPVYTAL